MTYRWALSIRPDPIGNFACNAPSHRIAPVDYEYSDHPPEPVHSDPRPTSARYAVPSLPIRLPSDSLAPDASGFYTKHLGRKNKLLLALAR